METKKNCARVRYACLTVLLGVLASPVVFAPQALAKSAGSGIAIGRNGAAQVREDCIGPGTVVTISFAVNVPSAVPVVATAALPPGLLALPGTCVATVGTCSVVNPSTVIFSATLAPGQALDINYQVQVGDLVSPATQFAIVTTIVVNGAVPGQTVTISFAADCPAVGPGQIFPATSEVSDQKAGSVLIYNLYTSSLTIPGTQNTRINITNVDPTRGIAVHLFFVDGTTCSPIDRYICLTPNQTMTFTAAEQDPGVTGYIVAIASSLRTGCPISFNRLIGDEFIKFSTGHAANLGAEAIAAIAGGLTVCNANSVTAQLNFDGISYNRLPRVLALDNIPSRADGNDTLLIVNRIGGNLAIGAATLGSMFGLLFDDAEAPHSFSFTASCQLRSSLSNAFPRTTPRFETVIPAGSTGWMKLWNPAADIAILGAQINFNANAGASAGAFNQGHNLHKLTLTSSANYVIPIFPPNC